MTTQPAYSGDCCPACGSDHILPYAVLIGGTEEHGYQCLACQVMWPILTCPSTPAAPGKRQETRAS